jgi:hypothetical protein
MSQFRRTVAKWSDGKTYRCPCCDFRTLHDRGHDEICPVCFWEDDGQDEQDADAVWGRPNGSLSLRQAQRNFKLLGACDPRHVTNVRKPERDEIWIQIVLFLARHFHPPNYSRCSITGGHSKTTILPSGSRANVGA